MICVVAIPFRGNVQILIKSQGVSSPCMSMGIGYCFIFYVEIKSSQYSHLSIHYP